MIMEVPPDGLGKKNPVTSTARVSWLSEEFDPMLNEDIESEELKFEEKTNKLEPRTSIYEEVLFGVLCDIFPEEESDLRSILENCDNRLVNAAKMIVEKAFERKLQLAQKSGSDINAMLKNTIVEVLTWDMSDVERQVVDSFVCEFGGDLMDALCCILEGTDYLAAIYDKFPQEAEWMRDIINRCHCAFKYIAFTPDGENGQLGRKKSSIYEALEKKLSLDLDQGGSNSVDREKQTVQRSKLSSSDISSCSSLLNSTKYQKKRKDSVIKHPPSRLTSALKKPTTILNTGHLPVAHSKEQVDFTSKLKLNYNLKAINRRIAELQTIKEIDKRVESPTLKKLREGPLSQRVLAAAAVFEERARSNLSNHRPQNELSEMRRKKMMDSMILGGLTPIEDSNEPGTSATQHNTPLTPRITTSSKNLKSPKLSRIEVASDVLRILSRYFPNHGQMCDIIKSNEDGVSDAGKDIQSLRGRISMLDFDKDKMAGSVCDYIIKRVNISTEKQSLKPTTSPNDLTKDLIIKLNAEEATTIFLNSLTLGDKQIMEFYIESCGGTLYNGISKILSLPKSLNILLNMADVIKENQMRASFQDTSTPQTN